MTVRIARSQFPSNVLTNIYNELTITAKGIKKNPKPKVTQLLAFDDKLCNLEDGSDDIAVPIQYARKKFKLQGLNPPKTVEYDTIPVNYREGQKEVFDQAIYIMNTHGSVFLQLHCGWGKTFLAINLVGAMKVRTLVLVHRKFLGKQFVKESENVIPGQIQIIEDSIVGGNTPGKCFVCTDRRALKLPEDFIRSIDMIVVDEAKYWCTPERLKALLRFRPKYTVGLCAERERKDGFDVLLDMFFGPVIFRKSVKPFIVWKYMTQFEPKVEAQKYARGPNWNVAMQSLAEMEARNIMIRDLCRLRAKDRILVLVTYVDHLQKLEKMLKDVGVDVGTFYGSKDNYKNCRVLLGTFSKVSIGFDEANLCEYFNGEKLNLLILGTFYNKEIEQSAGRIMRSDAPEIIDIVDKFPSLKKHSDTRDKFYRSRNGKIAPLEYVYPLK